MKVSNKAKAIKKANEYLELLRTMYSRDDKAYLYIYTWVDCATEEIISELNVNRRDGWWHPRTDWFKLMNDLDDAIRCNRISKDIKEKMHY